MTARARPRFRSRSRHGRESTLGYALTFASSAFHPGGGPSCRKTLALPAVNAVVVTLEMIPRYASKAGSSIASGKAIWYPATSVAFATDAVRPCSVALPSTAIAACASETAINCTEAPAEDVTAVWIWTTTHGETILLAISRATLSGITSPSSDMPVATGIVVAHAKVFNLSVSMRPPLGNRRFGVEKRIAAADGDPIERHDPLDRAVRAGERVVGQGRFLDFGNHLPTQIAPDPTVGVVGAAAIHRFDQ